MRVCKNDVTDELRRLFNANPLRVPQELYQPLLVLQIKERRPQPLGTFDELVRGKFNHAITISTSNVAELSGARTNKIGLGLGLNLLENFVKAFGMQPATIKAALQHTQQISFVFSEVAHKRFSPLQLGKLLSENEIAANTENMFVRKVLEDKEAKLAIVTDIITSKSFSIHTFDKSDNEVAIDVPAINNYLANVSLGVKAASSKKNEIQFKKDIPLTFAFSCVEILIDDKGIFSSGDWLDNIRTKNLETGESTSLNKGEMEHRLKLLLDEDENNPLLIE